MQLMITSLQMTLLLQLKVVSMQRKHSLRELRPRLKEDREDRAAEEEARRNRPRRPDPRKETSKINLRRNQNQESKDIINKSRLLGIAQKLSRERRKRFYHTRDVFTRRRIEEKELKF